MRPLFLGEADAAIAVIPSAARDLALVLDAELAAPAHPALAAIPYILYIRFLTAFGMTYASDCLQLRP